MATAIRYNGISLTIFYHRVKYSGTRYDVMASAIRYGTYRIQYNNTPGSLEYQRVVRYDAPRSTIQLHFCPVSPPPPIDDH